MTRKPERFQIIGSTRADRLQTISRIKDAIQMSGGWLTDFRMFSNKSICFNVEIDGRGLEMLVNELGNIGVNVGENSEQAVGQYQTKTKESGGIDEAGFIGTIQVTFIHNEPDLRSEVPAIPG